MSKHSPLPWWRSQLHPDWIIGHRNGMEAVIAAEVFQPADAEFIAQACNSHYAQAERIKALEEECEKLRDVLRGMVSCVFVGVSSDCECSVCIQVKAARALLGEK